MSARDGYIGRAPGDSQVVIAKQKFEPTGVQTNFTFTSGYTVGYIDVYVNGLRKVNASDYTASDGSTVNLTSSVGVEGESSVPPEVPAVNGVDLPIIR